MELPDLEENEETERSCIANISIPFPRQGCPCWDTEGTLSALEEAMLLPSPSPEGSAVEVAVADGP